MSAIASVFVQVTAAAFACAALTLWPPSSGKLLLMALGNTDAGTVAKIARAGGATLLGPGPLPGSLVVVGSRADVARQIDAWNILLLAAPPAGCGTVGTAA